jgi:hypothetical protein
VAQRWYEKNKDALASAYNTLTSGKSNENNQNLLVNTCGLLFSESIRELYLCYLALKYGAV